MRRLRKSEWVLTAFFAYLVGISSFFPDRRNLAHHPVFICACVVGLVSLLAFGERGRSAEAVSLIRDWLPLPLTFVAFREMDLFVPPHYPMRFEPAWNRWDTVILGNWHLRTSIEWFGTFFPLYLEICYLLVYGVGAYCVAVLYLRGRRRDVDRFLFVYLVGTLLAYALFPYFPSLPPRFAFPDANMPAVSTWARQLNLYLLSKATIQTGVFPSAHVSAAFSCAWGMFLALGRESKIPWLLLAYAVSVSVATVYGRYHYGADVAAGFAISLTAAGIGRLCGSKGVSERSLSQERPRSALHHR